MSRNSPAAPDECKKRKNHNGALKPTCGSHPDYLVGTLGSSPLRALDLWHPDRELCGVSNNIMVWIMNRFVAPWLVVILALSSMLLAPPVMAWTMPPMTTGIQSDTEIVHCLLCQHQSSHQYQQSANAMPGCSAAACGVIATVGTPTDVAVAFDAVRPSTVYLSHRGRLVPGPRASAPARLAFQLIGAPRSASPGLLSGRHAA